MSADPFPPSLTLGDAPWGATYGLLPSQIVVAFTPAAAADATAILSGYGLTPHDVDEDGVSYDGTYAGSKIHWVDCAPGADAGAVVESLHASGAFTLAAPVYIAQGERERSAVVPVLNDLVVEVAVAADPVLVDMLLRRQGLVFDEQSSDLLAPLRRYDAGSANGFDGGFGMLDRLAHVDGVGAVRPDWVKLYPFEDVTTRLTQGWSVATVNAPQAWASVPAGNRMTIAVIDSGFDVRHPDLKEALAGLSPADRDRAKLTEAELAVRVGDSALWHGTAVSGLIAVLARGCPLLPLRSRVRSADQHGTTALSSLGLSEAIKTAVARGARVINLSLSGAESQDVKEAIDAAVAAGVVVCAAAGNGTPASGSRVAFPARLEKVIAVGACDKAGRRYDCRFAEDVEKWFSRYDDDLDVMAPGFQLHTVDALDAAGYNSGGATRALDWIRKVYGSEIGDVEGNYFYRFSGTSAATAHVSALAGLVASTRPTGTAAELRAIIERSCDKVTGGSEKYSYKSEKDQAGKALHPNGTWAEEMGYGRINFAKAVAAAKAAKNG
jgi:hypothetical protein